MSAKVSHPIKLKNDLKSIFLSGLNAVKPRVLIKNKIKIIENNLHINDKTFKLNDKVYLIGFGKAVIEMSMEMEKLLQKRLIKGIISVPRGSIMSSQLPVHGPVKYHENCENNVADEETLKITREIMALAESLKKEETLIVLISGGGSALLAMPKPSISLEEKNSIWKSLQNTGADIREVNIIRQRLSLIKAGGLARLAHPAQIISLILSDIIGDSIELIAGGPTSCSFPDSSKIAAILKKHNFLDKFDEKMKFLLLEEELDEGKVFPHVENFIIGSNSSATDAARAEAVEKGLNPIIMFNDVQGLVQDVSHMYVGLARIFCSLMDKTAGKSELIGFLRSMEYLRHLEERADEMMEMLEVKEKRLLLIGSGEPTVEVRGRGKGGRNQELALLFSRDWAREVRDDEWLKKFDVVLLSAGTDGQDGPTDAAGAFGYSEIGENTDLERFLIDNNSYEFYSNFEHGRDLLKTGFTGTNVMDLHFLCIEKKKNHMKFNS